MITNLINRFSQYTRLSDEERQVLENATQGRINIEKGKDIISEGERPDAVHLIEEGWASRYKLLEQGEQHTMAFLLPGDLCDVHVAILDEMDHSIRALTPVRLTKIPADKMNHIIDNYPRLARAFFWSTLVDEAILREWLVSAGSRAADARLAHTFCELLLRSRAAGLTQDNSFELPLIQEELGEAMGLTKVHTNRIIQKLRREELVDFKSKRMVILDWKRMTELAGFRANYLHYQNQA